MRAIKSKDLKNAFFIKRRRIVNQAAGKLEFTHNKSQIEFMEGFNKSI